MGGVCTACNAPVEEEGKDMCPDCAPAEGGSEAPAEGGGMSEE